MTVRNISLMAVALLLTVTAVILLPSVYISADSISPEPAAEEYHCADAGCVVEAQTDGQCAEYAAAYVMRYLGEDISGEELRPQLKRAFGFVSPNSVAKAFAKQGCEARAYHGDLDTLKARLSDGIPVIVFIMGQGGAHYAVVTGFDAEYIYLADPVGESSGSAGYNRKIGIGEFEKLWKTASLIPDNTYIAVGK